MIVFYVIGPALTDLTYNGRTSQLLATTCIKEPPLLIAATASILKLEFISYLHYGVILRRWLPACLVYGALDLLDSNLFNDKESIYT